MATPRRTWTSIVIGTAIAAVALIVVAGLRIVSLVYQHVQEKRVTAEEAQATLGEARRLLAGREALVEIRDGSGPLIRRSQTSAGLTVTRLRALIYEAPSGRLIEDDVPFGVLRYLKGDGFKYLGELTPVHDDTEFEGDKVDVSLQDIERRGSLVVDHRHPNGSQVIVWVQ